MTNIPRLYVDVNLSAAQNAAISPEQSHYLKNVMRLKAGDHVRLFNGRDGEWRGEITSNTQKSKQSLAISITEQLKPQNSEPDIWLCCAPIKKAHFDYMIEKATELGVSVIQPLLTQRTQVRDVNVERCRAIAIEAAEQSERLSIPEFRKPVSLEGMIKSWPAGRALIVCAEQGVATPVKDAFVLRRLQSSTPAAIVTGPEGGFTAEEFDLLRKTKDPVFVRLGPRILRADTAAIAALSCWQALCGDWNKNPSI